MVLKKPAIDDIEDDGDEAVKPKAPSKTRYKKPATATVIESTRVSYDAEIDEGNTIPDGDSEGEDFDDYSAVPFSRLFGSSENTPATALAKFFNKIAESGSENFYISVERKPDTPTDSWNFPCALFPINFPPITMNVRGYTTFISQLQKMNRNSGGRFDISATDQNGRVIQGAFLKDYVVSNPVEIEKPTQDANMMQMFMAMMEQSRQDNQAMIQAIMDSQKKDRFAEVAEQAFLERMANPPESKGFDPSEMMMQLFTTKKMMETMSDSFADAMNGKPDDRSGFERFLESDAGKNVVEKGLGVAEQVAVALPMIARQKAEASKNPAVLTEGEEYMNDGNYGVTEFMADVTEELFSGNPLDATNEFIQGMQRDYKEHFDFVVFNCNRKTFEEVFTMLTTQAPDAFVGANIDGTMQPFWKQVEVSEEFPKGFAPTETGQKMIERLKELYEYLKTITL